MKNLVFLVLAFFVFSPAVAQEYDNPVVFSLASDFDKPVSFSLVSKQKPPIPVVKSPQLKRIIQPRRVRQPDCHFVLKSQRWYYRGTDLAGHVLDTHGWTVQNVFGYTNNQVRRMTFNQLVILHSNAHEWELGRRWLLAG